MPEPAPAAPTEVVPPGPTASPLAPAPTVAADPGADPTVAADPGRQPTSIVAPGWGGGDEATWRQEPSWTGAAAPSGAPPGPSAGTLGVPGAPTIDDRGNLPGGVVALLGAVTVAVAVALPWLEVAGETVSGWSASEDAKVLAGLAGITLVAGALVVGGARSLVLRMVLALGGSVAVGLGVFDLLSVSGLDELDPDPGLGIYLGVAGGVVLLVAAALTRHRRFT